MQAQIFQMAPINVGRNENMYLLSLWGSILLFLMNLSFGAYLLFYLVDHDYKVISENAAVTLMVIISLGCFVGLATLYSITMNEQAYHALRPVSLTLIWIFLGAIVFETCWSLVYSISSPAHAALLKLLIIPTIIEGIVYFGVFYGFYHLHTIQTSYMIVPQYPHMNINFPMFRQY